MYRNKGNVVRDMGQHVLHGGRCGIETLGKVMRYVRQPALHAGRTATAWATKEKV